MLKGKVAIVTGSTSGIGLGIARELAKAGANLVLNGFGDASEIEAIRSGIERDHDVRVVYDGADMSKAEAVRGLISATIETFGRLDILVNNAGIQFTAPVEEFPAAKWNAILDINLLGRCGVPDDVAEWIVRLTGPASEWMTGQVVAVDGGLGLA